MAFLNCLSFSITGFLDVVHLLLLQTEHNVLKTGCFYAQVIHFQKHFVPKSRQWASPETNCNVPLSEPLKLRNKKSWLKNCKQKFSSWMIASCCVGSRILRFPRWWTTRNVVFWVETSFVSHISQKCITSIFSTEAFYPAGRGDVFLRKH